MRLEPAVWEALREICGRENLTPGQVAVRATRHGDGGNRTSAIRTYIIKYFREAATAEGHSRAGNGVLRPEDS